MASSTEPAPETAPGVEQKFWSRAQATWQPLFGGFFTHGVSIEWHDFHLEKDLDWARSFHPQSLEVCLNFSGAAEWHGGPDRQPLASGEVAAYTVAKPAPKALRKAGTLHRFITMELSAEFLRTHYGKSMDDLKPAWRRFVAGEKEAAPYLEITPMSTPLLALRQGLLAPPVPTAARSSWYLAKTMEVLAHVAFGTEDAGEMFCHQHQRQNRERVERARYLLERDLENPPSLEMLAQEVGCSTFHLSRIFAEQMAMSIPKFLRTRRIESAAELLRSGKMNVTQAAMAVGYSSLSAFNKAFVEQIGCCPGLYPALQSAGRPSGR
jgi:AraC family transcriptional regulator